jgi:uncharacterized protein YfaS (alpha-2-macroglobulin family)
MKHINFLLLLSLLSLGLVFDSCSSKKNVEKNKIVEINPGFSNYISAFTGGIISNQSTIQIRLAQPYEGEINLDEPIPGDLFSFSPTVRGEAYWKNNTTIEFIPEDALISEELYQADFKLGNLVEVPEEFKLFQFNFKVKAQTFNVFIDGINTPSFDKPSQQIIEGKLSSSDIIDSTGLKKLVHAYQDGAELPIQWDFTGGLVKKFIIKNIKRKDVESKVTIEWNGGAIDSELAGSKEVKIPALGDFKIVDISVVQAPEQHAVILFSDPLDDGQDLNGIVSLGSSKVSTIVDGHKLLVYPTNRLSGEKNLKISTGIKNFAGYKLKTKENIDVVFEDIKPKVELLGDGVIVPSSQGAQFPFKAVNLKAVDVFISKIYEDNIIQFLQVNNMEGQYQLKRVGTTIYKSKLSLEDKSLNLNSWNNFSIDLSSVIKIEPGAIYRVSVVPRKKYSLYSCSTSSEVDDDDELVTTIGSDDEEWTERDWGSSYYYDYDYGYDYYYDYDYNDRDNPCKNYYYRNKTVSRNVLISDIGIIAKAGGDKNMHVFLSDINTTKPIANAKVKFYDYQQKLLGSTLTDEEGMCEMKLKRKPFVLVAENGTQKGYLKLRDGESNSLSKFSVSGSRVQKGVKGFIYTERGVWRPGDSLYVTFILEDKEDIIPEDHPVKFELINSRGIAVDKQVSTFGLNGFYHFRTSTYQDAPTGNYRAKVSIGNRTFTKSLKVETVKPNRLKIYLEFADKILKKKSSKKSELRVKWLHGAVAKNLKSKIDVTVSSSYTSFKGYKGFIFDDPIKRFRTDQQTIFNSKLDDYGVAKFDPKIYVTDAAPGMLKANFVTKVFEEGGAFSIDRSSIKYSPYTQYAGVKIPKGSMYGGTLVTDEDHLVEIATVNEDGKGTNADCEVKVYKLQWRWWWDSYDRNVRSYISRSSTTPIFSDRVRTTNGKGKFNLRVNRPEYGRYLVYVKNLESGHTTGKIIYIDWPYWARSNRKNTENSTMLAFSTDKEAYLTDEQVKLSIPSPANGRALITIENGTKVLKKFWIDTKKGETKVEFPTTAEMSPNAYVHVTLVQPHAETGNDLPIRMYGVVPIMVENPKSHINPVIKMADQLRPETTTRVRISEKSGKPMTYTLAIVDEGLLDLTSFKTPNAWKHFYAKEALGVRTWDLYDEVLGAFGSKINKMLAIGGDGAGGKKKQAKANRFKPMVRYVGPFYYDGHTENNHKIDIPNYIGSVRVMVVAGKDEAYGKAEKTVPVKSPLMVLGTLPRVLGPGEEVDLPVNVFATEDYIKDVKITIKANDLLIPQDQIMKTMKFSKKGDKVVNFRLKVAEKLGIGRVSIDVKSGSESAHYDVELDVRPSNPKTVNVQEIVVQPGETWKGTPEYFGIDGTNSANLEVSTFPPLNLEKRLKYLIRYPHGCIEQTTSGAFPQLYLSRLMELDNNHKIVIQQNIDAAIARISLFQTSQGGFSYWPGGTQDNEWGTNYAGHFLLEAEKLGYKVPSRLKSRWIRYQKNKAKNWYALRTYKGRYNDITQAYRLYTLALANKSDLASMNRLREKRDLSITARWRLAAAYKLAGQYEIANQLVKGFGTAVPDYTELSYSFGNSIRDEAMILETLTLMNKKSKGFTVAKRIAKKLSSRRWMSTQTTSYCLLALGKYMGAHAPSKVMYFDYKIGSGDRISKKTMKPMLSYNIDYKHKNIEVKNNGQSPLFVRVMTTGIPMQGFEKKKSENVAITVAYTDMDGKTINPKQIEQGTDFIAEVTVRNLGLRGYLKEMALNQIFPSGWEIHNTRMDGFRSAHSSSSFVYQDIRDDRVYTYYNLAVNQTRTYRVQLNATYRGKFYMPSVATEAMYDNTISALEPGGWVEVVKQTND